VYLFLHHHYIITLSQVFFQLYIPFSSIVSISMISLTRKGQIRCSVF
jgi:hypothetical protein